MTDTLLFRAGTTTTVVTRLYLCMYVPTANVRLEPNSKIQNEYESVSPVSASPRPRATRNIEHAFGMAMVNVGCNWYVSSTEYRVGSTEYCLLHKSQFITVHSSHSLVVERT